MCKRSHLSPLFEAASLLRETVKFRQEGFALICANVCTAMIPQITSLLNHKYMMVKLGGPH